RLGRRFGDGFGRLGLLRLGLRRRCGGSRLGRRCGLFYRTGELALAVQLVEQRLELVVGGLVATAGGRSRSLGLGRRGRGFRRAGELALAVQLVEQRIELVVGDLVATAGGRSRGLGL